MKIAPSWHRWFFLGLLLPCFLGSCTKQPHCEPCSIPAKNHGETVPLTPNELYALYAGSAIGNLLPMPEKIAPARALYAILVTTNKPASMSWTSPLHPDKYSGDIILYETKKVPAGQCRNYLQTLKINDKTLKARGKLCRSPKLFWRIVEEHRVFD